MTLQLGSANFLTAEKGLTLTGKGTLDNSAAASTAVVAAASDVHEHKSLIHVTGGDLLIDGVTLINDPEYHWHGSSYNTAAIAYWNDANVTIRNARVISGEFTLCGMGRNGANTATVTLIDSFFESTSSNLDNKQHWAYAMRLFGSERIMNMMETLGIDEDTPIDARILSGAIENAQKTVEGRNFQSRKNVLEYDDVMNVQRKIIYEQRRQVLDGEDLQKNIQSMMRFYVDTYVASAFGEQPKLADKQHFFEMMTHFEPIFFPAGTWLLSDEELAALTREQAEEKILSLMQRAYAKREEQFTSPVMREIERVVTLRVVDEFWMDHIDAMDDLRQGIRLRAYAQTDPVIEYKREGFDMFEAMNDAIKEEIVRRVFLVRIKTNEEIKRQRVAKVTGEGAGGDKTVKRQPVVKKIKVGPNDPCPCGSGKKYKKCCRDKDLAAERGQNAN